VPSVPLTQATSGGLAAGFNGVAERAASGETEGTSSGRRWYATPIVWGAFAAVLLVAAAVFSVTILGLFAPIDRAAPQASVSGYFHAVQANDSSTAWQYTADSRNNPSAQQAFVSGLGADNTRFGKIVTYHITQVNVDSPGHAEVTVTVTRASSPATTLTYTFSVTQYDGTTWLIDSVSQSS
jgi:hypothetical protein